MAIDEALRRFDGGEARPRVRRPVSFDVPLRAILGRPQIAVFATIVLVAFLSLPLWLSDIGPRVQRDAAISEPSASRSVALDVEEAAPPPAAAFPPQTRAQKSMPQEREGPAMSEEDVVAVASADALPVGSPPAPASERTNRFRAAEEPRGDERERSASPRPAIRPGAEERSIIVTGGRIAPSLATPAENERLKPAFAEPGNWRACTILDSGRDLQACRELANPARPGSAGRGAAHFLDGLRLAWEGDSDGALESFDRSIALAPDLSIAYLNRGLTYRQNGDTVRALADFGRAIERNPDFAPAYYHRSQLLRAQGKTAQADSDMERAMRLAP